MILDVEAGPRRRCRRSSSPRTRATRQLLFGAENASPYVKDSIGDFVVGGRIGRGEPGTRGAPSAPPISSWTSGRARSGPCACGCGPATAAPATLSARPFEKAARGAAARGRRVLRSPPGTGRRRGPPRRRGRPTRGFSGRSSSTTTWSRTGLRATRPARRRPAARLTGRNSDWPQVYSRDVISMPDKWEYPWFAAWDLAFHMLPMARLDPAFAKEQLNLLLREWYMHPNGQIPAYEWNFSDVNPPVHAWACWRVYKITAPRGQRDRAFLARVFQKLLVNFTWWVNRKDVCGRHIFSGGFLGLDNVGVFDRSKPLPGGRPARAGRRHGVDGVLLQHDARHGARAGGGRPGLRGHRLEVLRAFRRDRRRDEPARGHGPLARGGRVLLRPAAGRAAARSRCGCARSSASSRSSPSSSSRRAGSTSFRALRSARAGSSRTGRTWPPTSPTWRRDGQDPGRRLLAIPTRDAPGARPQVRLRRGGVPLALRHPLALARLPRPAVHGGPRRARPTASTTSPANRAPWLFGGNSNWRGPVWFPLNYILIEALQRYHRFYGDSFTMEFPTGSGRRMNLDQIAREARPAADLALHAGCQRPTTCIGGQPELC